MPTRHIRLLLACLFLIAAALPAAARADSIVFIKGGEVWVGDSGLSAGSTRQFTIRQDGWRWPSMADDGTVVAAGGPARPWSDGSSDTGSSRIYSFSGDGNQIGTYTPTPATHATADCPSTAPTSMRVSPDATKIAYSINHCQSVTTTFWTRAGSTGLDFPHQTEGLLNLRDPIWINNSYFATSAVNAPGSVGTVHWSQHLVTNDDSTSETAWK